MLRNSAAKDAHRNNGEVVKAPKGYMVKLKEIKNAKITEEFLQTETSTGSTTATSYTITVAGSDNRITVSESCDGTGGCDCTTEGRKKITIGEIRTKQKEKLQKESIDKGIESGMSMAAGGENGSRDMGEKLNKKGKATPVAEMQGDETTASIGDKKEDEMKKVGISLTSFRKKNYL